MLAPKFQAGEVNRVDEEYFLMYFYASNLGPPGARPF